MSGPLALDKQSLSSILFRMQNLQRPKTLAVKNLTAKGKLLLRVLCELSEQQESLDIHVTQSELAALISSSSYYVNRQIQWLAANGAIEVLRDPQNKSLVFYRLSSSTETL